MEIIPNRTEGGRDRRGTRVPSGQHHRRSDASHLVTGLDASSVHRVGDALEAGGIRGGSVQVHHDLTQVEDGRVVRTLSWRGTDGRSHHDVCIVELAHGCISCTLREDLLPLLRRLHRRPSVHRIVLTLDPILEPEQVAWSIDNVIVSDMPGFDDGPASTEVRVDATIACVAEDDWLTSATGDLSLAEGGHIALDDDRTLAQVAVGQVAFADALIVAACDPTFRDAWQSARLVAVLKRLAPNVPMMFELPRRPVTSVLAEQLLAAVRPNGRRGRVDDPHDPLLPGEPPLDSDCGVSWVEFASDRPFHPGRFHDAIDALLDGVVCSRGRLWVATQPDEALWLESAGGGLRVAHGGPWLAAMAEDELARVPAERRAMGALRWDETFGDRHTSIVALVHSGDPAEIEEALRSACLNEVEFAAGQQFWSTFDDPFGESHADPCDDLELTEPTVDAVRGIDSPDPRDN